MPTKSPYSRTQLIARDCLEALARHTSMIKVKIALRDVLRDERDLAPTFAQLFEQTHVAPFEALLTQISAGATPAPRRTIQRRPPPVSGEKVIAGLVARIRDRFNYDPHFGTLTYKRSEYGKTAGEPVGTDNGKGTLQVAVAGRRFAASFVCWLHYYGSAPAGQIRMRKDTRSLAIKNLYVLQDSR